MLQEIIWPSYWKWLLHCKNLGYIYHHYIFRTSAAWLMGLSLVAYLLLAITGIWMFRARQTCSLRPKWLRSLHYVLGGTMLVLVLLLSAIGIAGTLNRYGTVGHSSHLLAGLTVLGLILLSGASATQMSAKRPWVRSLHIGTNITLSFGLLWVSLTGWSALQKYLP